MNKPCNDCYQTRNIHGFPFDEILFVGGLRKEDHVSEGTYNHSQCPPKLCSGHVPIYDSFHAFVLETLECEER